jgi:C4-dicarboxylate transporter DctQ subunit
LVQKFLISLFGLESSISVSKRAIASKTVSLFLRFTDFVTLITCAIIVIFGIAFTIMISIEVFFRYILGASLFYVEAFSRIFFVWFVFLGSSLGLRLGSHIGFELAREKLPNRYKHISILLADFVVLMFLIGIFLGGIRILPNQLGQVIPSLGISIFWSYLAIPIGCALMIMQLIYSVLIRYFTKH